MKTVVTLTMNPVIDKSANVEQVVAERKLRCKEPRYEPGGGGVNVSRAIGKLGGRSLALFPCGGATGEHLLNLLGAEELDCLPIPIREQLRENFAVLEESSGRQFRFGMPGPNLDEEEWRRCLSILEAMQERPAYIVASGSLPPGVPDDFYARVARIGNNIGSKVIIDTTGEALRQALEEGVYLIKPNIREFGELLGRELPDEAAQKEAAMELIRAGKSSVVALSLGAGGVLLASENGCERLPTPVVPIKSKIGAGDSMVGGIVLSLAQDKPLRDAVRFGVAAGAAAVMTPGSELCRREDVERLYGQE